MGGTHPLFKTGTKDAKGNRVASQDQLAIRHSHTVGHKYLVSYDDCNMDTGALEALKVTYTVKDEHDLFMTAFAPRPGQRTMNAWPADRKPKETKDNDGDEYAKTVIAFDFEYDHTKEADGHHTKKDGHKKKDKIHTNAWLRAYPGEYRGQLSYDSFLAGCLNAVMEYHSIVFGGHEEMAPAMMAVSDSSKDGAKFSLRVLLIGYHLEGLRQRMDFYDFNNMAGPRSLMALLDPVADPCLKTSRRKLRLLFQEKGDDPGRPLLPVLRYDFGRGDRVQMPASTLKYFKATGEVLFHQADGDPCSDMTFLAHTWTVVPEGSKAVKAVEMMRAKRAG